MFNADFLKKIFVEFFLGIKDTKNETFIVILKLCVILFFVFLKKNLTQLQTEFCIMENSMRNGVSSKRPWHWKARFLQLDFFPSVT